MDGYVTNDEINPVEWMFDHHRDVFDLVTVCCAQNHLCLKSASSSAQSGYQVCVCAAKLLFYADLLIIFIIINTVRNAAYQMMLPDALDFYECSSQYCQVIGTTLDSSFRD